MQAGPPLTVFVLQVSYSTLAGANGAKEQNSTTCIYQICEVINTTGKKKKKKSKNYKLSTAFNDICYHASKILHRTETKQIKVIQWSNQDLSNR